MSREDMESQTLEEFRNAECRDFLGVVAVNVLFRVF